MKRLWAIFVALAAAACGGARAWNYDETERIADVMACDRFDPDGPDARGIPLHQMPAQAKPSPRSLSLSNKQGGRKRRVRSLAPSRQKPAAKAQQSDKERATPKEQ